ncbi:MAG: RcnB family protein [Phenylobacterium sp.]
MKRILATAAAALMALSAGGSVMAQPYGHAYGHDKDRGGYDQDRYDHDRYDHDRGRHRGWVRHDEWRPGYRIEREYWSRGDRIDWRYHHLRQPPRGYEWREVDGNYVLAAVATGLIASIIANSR